MKLNLGCGSNLKPGYENYDKYPINDAVRFLDLEQLPLTLPSGYADEIYMHSVFEHMNCDVLLLIKELYRVLKPGGILIIGCPSFCPRVEHTIPIMNADYFDSLCIKDYKPNMEYIDNLFIRVEVKKNINSFRGVLFRCYRLFQMIFISDYTYRLKKVVKEEERNET